VVRASGLAIRRSRVAWGRRRAWRAAPGQGTVAIWSIAGGVAVRWKADGLKRTGAPAVSTPKGGGQGTSAGTEQVWPETSSAVTEG
jgi:hypothetical protein